MRLCAFPALALLIVGCQSGLEARRPGLTKKEVVERVGLPAEIELGGVSQASETWAYFEESPSGEVEKKVAGFSYGRLTLVPSPNINPKRLLNPDKPEDYAKIAGYERRLRNPGGIVPVN